MRLRKVAFSRHKEIPRGGYVRAVYLSNKKLAASSAWMVLRKVCEELVESGRLTEKKIRGFGFSWIAITPGMMHSPALLRDGIYLSESGDDNTMYIRLSLILKRLLITQEECEIEYEEDYDKKPVSGEKKDTWCHFKLKEWDDSDEEPYESVKKRINELRPSDFKMLLPYKLGIGNKKYRTESWSDLVNTFVVYIYSFSKNGPSLLWDIQSSVHWKHPMMVRREGDRISLLNLSSGMDGAAACWMMGSLLNALQFDRYSVYVNCCPVNTESGVHSLKRVQDDETDVAPVGDVDSNVAQGEFDFNVEEEAPELSQRSEPWHEPRPINVTLGRHLRPTFWIG